MKNTRQLTLNYVKAFNNKNINDVLTLCDDNIYLKDPNSEFFNKNEFKRFLIDFFKNDISFTAKEIITDDITEKNHSVIHFTLQVNDKTFCGVDIIEWQDEKIVSLIAYVQ
jgi:hypothetical protein